ncbi:MAG TPA: carboxylating nicotinate-nucleotide diphosphorylase [Pyrinomonadaceae bacterium]|jgi:nicotinate-nucleotide pyrophosphorylase (carboxylating)|nr:carboxylating nicotinate-nucleotide diphosphorylase [Pyrinomonadaceae bacterium]
MNWVDEGALYLSINAFLREDLGRGDITSQAIIERNIHARGRFIAGEKMIVAGLEAAEEVFMSLDSEQQLEAFASDGEEIEGGKVIARTTGFADVLLAGERVALNLLQRLSGIATLTNQYVRAVEGTPAKILDTRKTTPGLRMLEKYAVSMGGGLNHRFGLDDGVTIKANHIAVCGGIGAAVKRARERLGHLHRIEVQVSSELDLREALKNEATALLLTDIPVEETARLIAMCRELSPSMIIECSGDITLENVRGYAEAGADFISVGRLTNAARAMSLSFQMQLA